MSAPSHAGRVRHLSACLASALALAPLDAPGTTRIVNSCADSGAGSLRAQIGAAGAGDIIDLSTAQLACSTITLTSGQIPVGVDLTLLGPASRQVTITASPAQPGPNRLLNVANNIVVQNLTFTGGYYFNHSGVAKGGCIAAGASVKLIGSTVSGCTAYSYSGAIAAGGGIYAGSDVRLYDSTVSGNTANNYLGAARGGGISTGNLSGYYSTISGNVATSRDAAGTGGGAYVGGTYQGGSTLLQNSTIDSNFAQQGGGLYDHAVATSQCLITNSTISGNRATGKFGGVFCRVLQLNLQNSTVAFNQAANYAGVYAMAFQSNLSSSIVSRNSNISAGFADMFQAVGTWQSVDSVVGSYSPSPSNGPVAITADPRLAPLANHGGPTRTHALLATSPAIDNGNNAQNLATDQRGAGFARSSGGKADIGAYERQTNDDEIYYSGFQ